MLRKAIFGKDHVDQVNQAPMMARVEISFLTDTSPIHQTFVSEVFTPTFRETKNTTDNVGMYHRAGQLIDADLARKVINVCRQCVSVGNVLV